MKRFYVVAYQRVLGISEPVEVRVHADGPHIMDAVRKVTQHLHNVYAVKAYVLEGDRPNGDAA